MNNTVFNPLAVPVSLFAGSTLPMHQPECITYTLADLLLHPATDLIDLYQQRREVWEAAGAVRCERYKYLLSITTAGTFTERKNDSLVSFSSLYCLDFDAKDNKHLTNWNTLLQDVFPKIPFVAFAAKSFSGNGYYCLVPIDDNPQRYSDNARKLMQNFAAGGMIADNSCSDVSRLRFYVPPAPGQFYYNEAPQRFKAAYSGTSPGKPDDTGTSAPTSPGKPDATGTGTGYKVAVRTPGFTGMYDYQRQRLEQLIQLIESTQIDITANYNDWVKIAFVLNNEFGEAGRAYFHRLSRFHHRYSYEEAEQKYTQCSAGKSTLSALYGIANDYGVRLKRY
jgi:hypothetical protein